VPGHVVGLHQAAAEGMAQDALGRCVVHFQISQDGSAGAPQVVECPAGDAARLVQTLLGANPYVGSGSVPRVKSLLGA
jgi:hypothetical protein